MIYYKTEKGKGAKDHNIQSKALKHERMTG